MKTASLKIGTLILVLALCFVTFKSTAKSFSRHFKSDKKSRLTFTNYAKHSSKNFSGMRIKNIHFGFNKATVNDVDFSALEKVAKVMIDNKLSVKVDGYADRTGGYVYNWKLSKARADAVKSFLVSKGVDSSRVAATEFGFTHPIASNKTAAGRKMNRRVEIKVVS